MLINFVDATNDANHYTKPPPREIASRELAVNGRATNGQTAGCMTGNVIVTTRIVGGGIAAQNTLISAVPLMRNCLTSFKESSKIYIVYWPFKHCDNQFLLAYSAKYLSPVHKRNKNKYYIRRFSNKTHE